MKYEQLSEQQIPDDLKAKYETARHNPDSYMGSAPFYNRNFVEMIDRIVSLQAELEAKIAQARKEALEEAANLCERLYAMNGDDLELNIRALIAKETK